MFLVCFPGLKRKLYKLFIFYILSHQYKSHHFLDMNYDLVIAYTRLKYFLILSNSRKPNRFRQPRNWCLGAYSQLSFLISKKLY